MIEVKDVRKVFNQGRPNEFWAIRGVSLRVEENRITVLKGPSGSGKTTLLSMIGGLSRPTAGRILLRGEILSGLPERFLTHIRRRTFGFVFQQFNLVKGLTALENVMLPAYPLAPEHRELSRKAGDLLRQFNLESKADAKVEWLSGGEAQRVAICRALVNDPEVLICDEPTANLDTRLSHEFMAIVSELKQAGKNIIITSHDPLVFDFAGIDAVLEMRDGRLAEG